jgi:hypothetical protein
VSRHLSQAELDARLSVVSDNGPITESVSLAGRDPGTTSLAATTFPIRSR